MILKNSKKPENSGGTAEREKTVRGHKNHRVRNFRAQQRAENADYDYKVKSGDTLSEIAESNGFTLDKLLEANPSIKNPDRIRAGQKINFPEKIVQDDGDEADTHTIEDGDTLYALARQYNTTVDILARENGITDPRKLQIGQTIKISGEAVQESSPQRLAFNTQAQKPSPIESFNHASSNLGCGTNQMPRNIQDILNSNAISGYQHGDYENLVAHMKLREGYSTELYRCTANQETFGIGHKLVGRDFDRFARTPPSERTQLAADFFNQDISRSFAAALQQAQQLPAHARTPELINALTSVNFQLGTGWNTIHKNTWSLMTQGRFDEAATEAAISKWNAQTPVRVQDFQVALHDAAKSPATQYALNTTPSAPIA